MIAALPSSLVAAFPLAFAAGLLSFISPCVLPLLPGYVAFLGGAVGASGARSRGRALRGSLAFVAGFAVVFVSFGALFGGLGATLRNHQRGLEIGFGAITILMGLFFAQWWPGSWLQRERRVHHVPRATVAGAGLLGVTFALGWTPCIGPTLAAILGLAASSSGATALRGSLLAFVYCWGLGVPFVAAAWASDWMALASARMRRHLGTIGRIGGVVLIAIGVAEMTGAWSSFVLWLQVHFPATTALL